jgi:hypothetical protein
MFVHLTRLVLLTFLQTSSIGVEALAADDSPAGQRGQRSREFHFRAQERTGLRYSSVELGSASSSIVAAANGSYSH